MKRLHVNLDVLDVNQSVDFYSHLFNSKPTVMKHDYAKWFLDDPKVNFSISTGGKEVGVQHLGIQTETEAELQEVYDAMRNAEGLVREEGHTTCCYALSEKSWIKDPQGVEWEVFRSYGESETNKGEKECCDDTCCTV